MPVEHVPADASPKRVAEILNRDACCIVDRVVSPDVMDRVADELKPWLDAVPCGPDDFSGRKTQRVGGLIARSQTARELVENPVVLGA
ncbi:MAG: phytanoyl-CoA dioxygenase family protein, partial [Myxococcota bacterium]